ncbi:MAG: hypothetical protein V4719_30685, partial [Planctomycetota bacterium]
MVQRKKLERRKAARQEAVLLRISERRAQFRDKVRAQPCPSCGSRTISHLYYGQPTADTEYSVDIDADLIFDVGRNYMDGDPVWICRDCVHTWGRRDAADIRWTAYHSSGFSESLLGYKLRCEDGIAELNARWSWPKPSSKQFLARFAIDSHLIATAIPALRTMNERYDSGCDDLGHWHLVVETGGEIIKR